MHQHRSWRTSCSLCSSVALLLLGSRVPGRGQQRGACAIMAPRWLGLSSSCCSFKFLSHVGGTGPVLSHYHYFWKVVASQGPAQEGQRWLGMGCWSRLWRPRLGVLWPQLTPAPWASLSPASALDTVYHSLETSCLLWLVP